MTMGKTGMIAVAAAFSTIGPPANAGTALPASFTVLTYNVEGLPWPVRWGRDAQAARIAASLSRLRDKGAQPHVIVLQEAFTPAAKAIAINAGYRYVVDGPARDTQSERASSPQDRQFVADAGLLTGEGQGKWADSGLRIASDYKILSVRRMAFPEYACAGLDCLANKGVVAVTLAVPGMTEPVVIVATHLNARNASGVSHARSLHAFQRQIDLVGAFIRANVPASLPMVFAGDFNAGDHVDRRSYLFRSAALWRPRSGISVALDTCLAARDCRKNDKADIVASYRHGRDWQFYSPGRSAGLHVAALSAPFGHDPAGAMLSDHIGYVAAYSIRPFTPAAPVRLATR